jgi:dienelactone hydrolase
MKLLQFVARKSLLALGYPRLETSHPELGVHEVGAYRARMSLSPFVPACQFFYPVDPNSKTTKRERKEKKNKKGKDKRETTKVDVGFVPYYRKEAVDGLMEFLNGFGDGILQILQEKAHPLQDAYGVDPLLQHGGEQFPLVLFSHGLGGTMDMYTELCSQIASTGCVVVALEHEDGSASYATAVTGIESESETVAIPYKRPLSNAKVPYSRQKVLDFRTPMLEHRVEELRRICDSFVVEAPEEANAETGEDYELVRKIVSATDPSKLHLVGHSFGGATQLLAAQTWAKQDANAPAPAMEMAMATATATATTMETTAGATSEPLSPPSEGAVPSANSRSSETRPPVPLSITVYDAWNTALSDRVLEDGLDGKCKDYTQEAPLEILSVLSEGWVTGNPEREQTLKFLRNCRSPETNVRSCYARESLHQSISDTEAYVPSFAARKLGNRGRGEPRHRTIRAVVREISKFTNPASTAGRKHDDEIETDENDHDSVLVPFPLR